MNWNGLAANSYWYDSHRILFNKDCRSMSDLPDESVQMVVTSPPFWGLRRYAGLPDLIWGNQECQHQWGGELPGRRKRTEDDIKDSASKEATKSASAFNSTGGNFCSLCGVWKGSYGIEPSPELYVQHTIEILREIRRVLRKDGVCFWDCGDSYAGSGSPGGDYRNGNRGDDYLRPYNRKGGVLKPKDLCLIPFRVAIAAQEDGWWVRSVIIWSKPNPMPESVKDRPTKSHEYILMLTKSARYYWDSNAVREPHQTWDERNISARALTYRGKFEKDICEDYGSPRARVNRGYEPSFYNPAGRNLRSVWTFPTQPYPEAHFATYPEKLVEICVKAATPEVGCCSKCGEPWVRQRASDIGGTKGHSWHPHEDDLLTGNVKQQSGSDYETYQRGETLGWQPQCKCNADKVQSIVLDPFAGSGTTLKVAAELNRRAIGYELSEEYCGLVVERNRQAVLV